jgi:cytochrome c biogenesis protein CcmG/thiol:disulfide interchange protein DsbE
MSKSSNNKQFLLIGAIIVVVAAIAYIFFSDSGSAKKSVATTSQPQQTVQQSQVQKSAVASTPEEQYPEAPDFELPSVDGKQIKLSDFKGKVVFLNFWATWCPPCRREIPAFIDLIKKYGNDGFIVLGVAVDPREFTQIDKVKPFVKQMGMNYPVVYDTKGISQMYGGIRSIPTTFVINRQGKVVGQIVGSRPKATFESIIKDLL